MTQTINITQDILNALSSGSHILTVTATTDSGFSASDNASFSTVSNPQISVSSDSGEHAEGFDIPFEVFGINGSATITGSIDGQQFYRLNFAIDGLFSARVSDFAISSLGGGSHTITFSLEDERGKTTTASTNFIKTYSLPVVSVASNIGDKTSAFVLPFTIRNAQSEHPSLVAYMDTVTEKIFETDDASNINSITVDVSELESGTHSIILSVTNDAGTTTKNTAFNYTVDDTSYTGLKLGYLDDTWDATVVNDRIYTETEVTYDGNTYKSYKDDTPYDTEGEVVTGGLLAAMSRGVQNASASTLTRNADGSYTEISANGVSNLVKTDNGYAEVFTDKEGNILTKNVYINTDGSVSESTTFERA